ncbi:MAG: hypothetical protein M1823_005456 [Watsoniomyces obsoletus]|nr:MAG: hypothetical protein M1823_005456 [Watsoniomyces obsoletus]
MPRLSRPSRAAQPQDTSPLIYEPVSHPLTPSAQHALRNLAQTHSLSKLQAHIQAANGAITEMAGEINDRLIHKEEFVRRRRQRGAGADEHDTQLEGLREVVRGMTAEMEVSTRKLVDVETQTRDIEDALRELGNDEVMRGAAPRWGGNATQQATRRRRRRGGARRDNTEDGGIVDSDADEDEEMLSLEETEEQEQDAGLMKIFKKNVHGKKERFDALPKRQKYTTNNNYIGFKRIVHDALNPGEDAPPVPHADTWFPATPHSSTSRPSTSSGQVTASQGTGPGGTQTQRSNGTAMVPGDVESDDDIAIAREKVSLKCPITLLPFRHPVTSTKCPHSFEREAVMDMISQSAARLGGRRRGEGVQAVKCPVCEQMLTKNDFFTDQILIRRIKRSQQAELNPEEEDDDDDEIQDDEGEGDESVMSIRARNGLAPSHRKVPGPVHTGKEVELDEGSGTRPNGRDGDRNEDEVEVEVEDESEIQNPQDDDDIMEE